MKEYFKEVMNMILALILAIILITLLVIVIAAVTIGGTAFIVIFGDVIVCIAIIAAIIYWLVKRKRK